MDASYRSSGMEKENGEGAEGGGKPPPDGMLDAASLFGAYWGRDGSGGSAAAAAAAQAQAQALFGFGSRYPGQNTLGVAANQAASLGLHPAASAAWWSMASQLAAQDYLHRLGAAGLGGVDPYSMHMPKHPPKHKPPPTHHRNERSGRSSTSSTTSVKDKSPSISSSQNMADWGAQYGFPKTSSPSTMHSQASLSSLASLNKLVSSHHKSNKQPSSASSQNRKSSTSSSSAPPSKTSERDLAVLRGDLMLAQAAAHGAYQAAMAHAVKGKNMNPLYPFGMPGSEKDRHSIDALTGLPHNLLSAALEGGDPASVLGGVRLPPDTEIIKYTSSLAGPKVPPGSTNRGRKKTISLDPPHVSVHPATEKTLPNKRHKPDDYSSKSSVEVIRLPSKSDKSGNSMTGTPPPNLSDYAGISRELLQTIASQSGVSLAALERQLAGSSADSGLNLSTKLSSKSEESPLDLGAKNSHNDEDAPLNLSLKPMPRIPTNTSASDALSRLSSLSSSLSVTAGNDRISRRKPGAKPRRVAPEPNSQMMDPRPRSSGSEDSESAVGWTSREGRPRNLGRGVSKPKKNTVASLLAQSRALGLRPSLAQHLLAETDLEKLKLLLGETASTDSECPSDSGPSDSDNDSAQQYRTPLALGWNRITIIKGLSRNCSIKGDVTYTPPEPSAGVKIKSLEELQSYLDQNPSPPLSREHFTFNSRTILGEYVQPPIIENGEPLVLSEHDIAKRLKEARALAALTAPPPVDRRIELARRQQQARDARRDAASSRHQARLVRDMERSEKAELVKREKEARSQQLLEHINKNRTQLTIEPLPVMPKADWKIPDIKTNKERTMPSISLSLIPVTGKDTPIKVDVDEYNALDKMKDFAEKVAFDIPSRRKEKQPEYNLKINKKTNKDNMETLIESYSRINEFINGCDWSKLKSDKKTDPKALEQKYLDAKNEFMTKNLMLLPKNNKNTVLKEVIDITEDDDTILNDIISKKISEGTFHVGKDGALSISVHPLTNKEMYGSAKKRKQEEIEKQKLEDHAKRLQEREIKRQQALLLKEQQKYITEERERRRQHTTFIRQLDVRRRWEDKERRKHQNLLDRLLAKEKKLQQRRKEMELLSELRRPREDTSLSDHKPLPTLERIPGLKIAGAAFADLLQVFEFVHNFGQTLGYEIEALPSLDVLQSGLIPGYDSAAEEELLQLLSQLLTSAMEDPGMPHPGRYTTLLGHALRMSDVTTQNISEMLRIYLYATATGEVKTLTGLTAERERERRVADHHQNEVEMQQTCTSTKNAAYYQQLHTNSKYKLSEQLRDKPYQALSATCKARILAILCDELLQNKSVIRQIDASLEHLNQLKKERYLMDMKIRKVRVQHQRKLRSEQTEKQQALALERMQKLVEENTMSRSSPQLTDEDHRSTPTSDKTETPKKSEHTDEEKLHSPFKDPSESDKELSPLKDLSNNIKNKEMMNNNKDECSPPENKDKDSVMGDCDAILSDLESEGTQPEEDEDKNLSAEELNRKLEKLLRQSEQQLHLLMSGSHALRATCYGQDRYWRRYWSLGKCGGIYVEAMESAQPEIMTYHQHLERSVNCQRDGANCKTEADTKTIKPSTPEESCPETEALKQEEALKSELELKNIKSELNLSDHTQIIKYEPNVKMSCKVDGSSIKMEEKYIQQQQHNETQDMLDIEDSIPTAFLVQKPTHNKPMFAAQPETVDTPQEIVKVENVKAEAQEKTEKDEAAEAINNLEELRKMAEAVSSELDAAKKEEELKQETEAKEKIKQEIIKLEEANTLLHTKMLEGKWFSILRHENSFLSDDKSDKTPEFCDNEHTCNEVVMSQGHKWDVSNNLHMLNDPSLFTLNSMVTSVQVPLNNVYADSSLTMSGLDQDMMDASLKENCLPVEEDDREQDNDLEKELQADALKHDPITAKAKANNLSSLGLLNFNALCTYVTCDSPPPIQMSAQESTLLKQCKEHGMPRTVSNCYVPDDLRHSWWRINHDSQLQELTAALHLRGVRERELHQQLTSCNKLPIDKGDVANTTLSGTGIEPYPPPEQPGAFCPISARRVDLRLLEMVEQLEERVFAASMQVKGWRPSQLPLPEDSTGPEIVARARYKLSSVEAHIERRYLKPPLVQSTNEANLGAVLQGEHGNSSVTSPQNSDHNTDSPKDKGIARGLSNWREAVGRCNTSAQLAMLLHTLEAHVAWDKSIMKANCQFCLSGDNEDQLLLCDGCDKGYHTYCFKPRMDKIPEGDWYCWECVNKARGERVCIVCGGSRGGRVLPCALCVRAYHQDCHYPPLNKNPRGKWYCSNCISRAPPKKPRNAKKRDSKQRDQSMEIDNMIPSPAPSHASTSTTAEEAPSVAATPEKVDDKQEELNHTNHHPVPLELPEDGPPPEKRRALQYVAGNGNVNTDDEQTIDGDELDTENVPLLSRAKKEKNNAKKMQKELQACKKLLCEMEIHEHAWPFLIPVNTKQFPQYKKVIKCPMDLSTIRKKLNDNTYKCKEEFASDVRLIFGNCEVFNEDDSPVGRAGHNMRRFFDERWAQL